MSHLSFVTEAQSLPIGRLLAVFLVTAQFSFPTLAQAANATITINANQTKATMPSQGLGAATAVYDNFLLSSGVAAQLSANHVQALRYPGGSYADAFHWQTTTMSGGAYINANNTFDNFMTQIVNPAGAKAIITTNYGSNAAGTAGGDPNEAAGWVAYAKARGYAIKYWEIGNEVGGNGYYGDPGWEYDLHFPYNGNRAGQQALSPATYGQNVLSFVSAMKAKDSSIKCGVGIAIPGTWPDTANPSYNSELLRVCGSVIDFVVIHWYPDGTPTTLLQSPSQIASTTAAVRSQLTQFVGARANQIELLITETGSGQATGMPVALFAADNYATWFENGATNVDWQELHTNFLSAGISGLADNTPLAAIYGARMVANLASAGDTFVAASSSSSLVAAHAVKKANGHMGIMLVNRDPSNSFTLNITVSGATFASSGQRFNFGAGNFNGSTPSSGPVSSTISGVGSTAFSVTVPSYTTTVLDLPAGGSTNPPPTLSNGTYRIIAHHSGQALDVVGAATADGTNVDQWPYSGGSHQRWNVTSIGNGQYRITGAGSGKALEVAAWSSSNGAKVDIWTVDNGANQSWTISANGNGFYRVLNVNSGLALEVAGASLTHGALVDQGTYSGANNQEWSFSAP